MCPTSNVHLGVYHDFSAVPLPEFISRGATVALGADDPLLFRSRLLDQYARAREVFDFSDATLANLAKQSIDASLASESSKRKWHGRIEAWAASRP